MAGRSVLGTAAAALGATWLDVVWSIGVVIREARRLRRRRREWRAEDATMHEEGLAPGPPVDPGDDDTAGPVA
jgi:hypothetical protein